ncbi:Ribosomal-protein-L7p-serine acetyltransferase [Alkalibacterium sp. AK22]|uniref:GNAT family N-acetyltransferase n=1 Tax=Alkalibacterium sp. AK22 TaxID=1229520 RepID=UPI00044F1CE2|nr:GNAT family protein [Alkalibacterium sp. AK22]EXJ23241.1 Ribosomal-protein-L7p-serine acetyltransferase [Alkalibacterium sp. AK22]
MFEYKIDQELSLKLTMPKDSAELFELIEVSRAHIGEWMSWVHQIKSQQDVQDSIEQNLIELSKQKGMHCLIVFRGKIIGSASLKYFDWDVRSAEIGYWISPAHEGKGVMSQTAQALTDYGFEYYKLNKIEIWAAEENVRSRSIPERLGFVLEGMRRANERINGRSHNMMIYGLLRSEWKNMSRFHRD